MKKPRVLLLFCGGTISMHRNEATGALDVASGSHQFSDLEPRISELAEIETRFVDNVDSTNMVAAHWERLGEEIYRSYNRYDGFLITMGTNTMAYCSSALSYSLQGIGKPVIITGAQIPAEAISTDARTNLVNSLRVAGMDLSGVYVVFGSRIILGSRAKKVSESELEAFRTFNAPDFGEIMIGIKINDTAPVRHDNSWTLGNGFEDNVVCLVLTPGVRASHLKGLIDEGARGLILSAYGSGDVPYDLLPVLDYAREKEIPVVITTQCPFGSTVMGINDPGLQALNRGVIQAFDMSYEAMSTKLMWLLRQGISYRDMGAWMQKSLCGEINTKRAQPFLNQELKDFYRHLEQV